MNVKDLFREAQYPIELFDSRGNRIYFEHPNGNWWKAEYDEKNRTVYYDTYTRWWRKTEYNDENNSVCHETSEGDCGKEEYDSEGVCIYQEENGEVIMDNRPAKELTLEEIRKELGYNVKVVR